MKYHLLLLEDIINHGRKGELVYVAPGYARNFLLPRGKALLASNATVRMREKLQKERAEQAAKDRKASLELAEKFKERMFETIVKVDQEGHLYGSVTAADISKILETYGYTIDKKCIQLHHPIKQLGNVQISLVLPEDVSVTIGLEVKPDREIKKKKAEKQASEQQDKESTEEAAETEVSETSKE